MDKNTGRLDFVAIDFETGMQKLESAVSVGLVKFINNQEVDHYYSLIRPPRLYIRPDFTEIHGITVEDVCDAPSFVDLWEKDIRPFIKGLPLAAHNALFDMGVLRAVLAHYDIPEPKLRCYCSLKSARKVWPDFKSHALTALARQFKITYDAHNALADARTCGIILLRANQENIIQ
ncbi:MAG: 3'-5' exonuclease [Prevotellaceae bacterium]|nr:3'-5' exonuclease [Prevotellaceae bacterium]